MYLILTILTVLSSFITNLETKTLQSDFTVTVADNSNTPLNYPGSITIHGEQFLLSVFAMDAAYDGQTLYIYSAQTDELTLSHPTQQELTETNPLLYAKTMTDVCNITENAVHEGKETLVTLTPKNQEAGIQRFTLRVRNEDMMPLQLEIKESTKTTTLRLTNPQFISEQPAFVLTAPDEDTFINDLRL